MKTHSSPTIVLFVLLAFFVKGHLTGQDLEAQMTLGLHMPKASIENAEQLSTAVANVKFNGGPAQAGLGIRWKIYKWFAFRAEANIRQYNIEVSAFGTGVSAYGIISHRKIAVAYLPEFRAGKSNTFFVSAGPAVYFEMGKKAKISSFSDTRFSNQG